MATKKKLLQAAAGAAAASGGASALNVEDVFSTYTYIGGTNPNYIDNGINLGVNNDGYSAYFDGVSDGLLVGHQSDLTTFTVEGWFYVTSLSTNRSVFTLGRSDIQFYYRSASNNMAIYDSSAKTYNFTPSTKTWYHFALVRNSSNSVELFIDGVSYGSNSSSATVSGDLVIGGYGGSASESFQGLISNVRVSNNVRYSSNFTAPTSALTADSNTTVLTVQDKTLVDNSGNNESVSVVGNTVMKAAAPFTADSAEGGMVWLRTRGLANNHYLVDTERGAYRYISPDATSSESGGSTQGVTEFNASGFTLGGTVKNVQTSGNEVVSWSWRKAPKFFDVQTWTGDSASDRAISHNLGSTPGMIFVKRTNASEDWAVWHKDVHANTTKVLYLNKTDALSTSTSIFGATNPSDTAFYVGNHPASNNLNDTYVAYIFAHNNGDGEFGPDADQDIIKCGSYIGNGSTNGPEIDLGFEPQWVIVKRVDNAGGWAMWDSIRGVFNGASQNDQRIYANDSIQAEVTSGGDDIYFTATGFGIGVSYGYMNQTGENYIYMAIRRPLMAVPTDATTVFAPVLGTDSSDWKFDAGFPVDLHLYKNKDSTGNTFAFDRRRGGEYVTFNNTAIGAAFTTDFDYMNYVDVSGSVINGWMTYNWRRAHKFFAISTWGGNHPSSQTISHNLGVTPEMIWVRGRNIDREVVVFHKDLGASNGMSFNSNSGSFGVTYWNSTAPTDTQFTVGNNSRVNDTGYNYVGYLFASVDGVSKVGSYTGDGNTGKQIDCGFSNGARFVLIKSSSHNGDWFLWDSVRGIVAGIDPYFQLNTNNAQNTGGDNVDPYSAGFIVNGPGNNANGVTYIFYAIA